VLVSLLCVPAGVGLPPDPRMVPRRYAWSAGPVHRYARRWNSGRWRVFAAPCGLV